MESEEQYSILTYSERESRNNKKFLKSMSGSATKEVKYRFQNVRGESCDPEESDYVVNLPSAVFSDLGLEEGAKDEVFLQLIDEEDNLTYIRGRKTEEGEEGTTTEGYFDVQSGGSLTIPNWADDFLPHPLYQVALEINLSEDHFRIYSPEDYGQYRLPELQKQGIKIQQAEPVVGPLVLTSDFPSSVDDGAVERLAPWFVSSQRFRLIMYDAYHPVFKQEASFKDDENYQPTPSLWTEVEDTDDLPRYPVEELHIEWARTTSTDRSHNIYSHNGEPIEELDIILPEKGFYTIHTVTDEGKMSGWFHYEDAGSMHYVRKGWGGTCLEIPEDEEYFIAYIPCKTDS